ncbi:S41 family peptidase [Nocardioides dongxiaopingii]|uniref:S41 family peptidase n=1 Tax=Nocardioides sp. S-1144 TaxID=2582905 RepID=UPI0016522DD5|nr:S41 family peptidase [Nocardioides sp. S-1144]
MIISRVQDLVRAHYVFPDVADQIAAGLVGISLCDDDAADAETLTVALQMMNGDRHLRVRHYPQGVPPEDDDAAVRTWFAAMVREQGPGISEVRRLEGNAGLVVIGPVIPPPEHLAPAAAAAFTLLGGATRLVLDVRSCVGGVPESVALLVSHLCGDEPVHLQDLVRRDGIIDSSYTTPTVSPRVPAEVPVVVLTSARTFSGGEEVAYDLQALGRAGVVGETTRGGAHPREAFDLTPHLQLHVPTARSVNAVTGSNWEGTGVVPDIEGRAEEALETALG